MKANRKKIIKVRAEISETEAKKKSNKENQWSQKLFEKFSTMILSIDQNKWIKEREDITCQHQECKTGYNYL